MFLIFMIILLPLRGWAGDVMRVQMTTSGSVPHAASTMPSNCPMHARAVAAEADMHAPQPPSVMESCNACDLCMPMADLTQGMLEAFSFAAHAKPPLGGSDFISAPAALALKPPIS